MPAPSPSAQHRVLLGGEAGPPLLVGEMCPFDALTVPSGGWPVRYRTTSETATNCVTAAAMTST